MDCLTRHPEVRLLLERFESEPTHIAQVAALALQLADLDLLVPALELNEREELEIASLLHDIGWAVTHPDGKGHHKESARMIRTQAWTTLSPAAVERVALTARYHRKSLPSDNHKDFVALPVADQQRVRRMSALLRVADGLDRRHIARVDRVTLEPLGDVRIVRVHSTDEVGAECVAADKKADLLRELTESPVRFEPGR